MPLIKALLHWSLPANFKTGKTTTPGVRPLGWIAALLLLFAMPASLFAQGTSAALSGTVTDPSGASVPAATVILQNVDTQTEQKTVSTESGSFSLINVQPGNYTVRVTKDGFNTLEKTGLVFQVNQTATLNFALTVGSTTQTVDVSATVSTVDSSTAELGTVVSERSVKDLPLNGRNFTQLLTLTPGISPVSVGQNSGGGGGFAGAAIGTFTFPSVGGQRNRSNMFLLDGVNDLAFIGNYNYSPIIDDIQEFKVQSHNDLAEFGQVSGGIINVASKAGSNTFHGSAWEFLRNEKLDARNYFQTTRNPLRQNQFGATLGGPVSIPHLYSGKDRTFFFFAYEGYHQSQNTQSVVRAPTPAQLSGDFSALLAQANPVQLYNPYSTRVLPGGGYVRDPFPNNQIPSTLLSPTALLYANTLLPTPSTQTISGGNLYDNTKAIVKSNSYSGRIDQTFGTRDVLFGRISYSNQPITNSAGYPGALNTISIESWNIGVHESHSFSPTAILDLTFGRNVGHDITAVTFTRAPADFGQQLISSGITSKYLTGFLSTPATLTPLISVTGYTSTGGNNLQNTQLANTYQGNADFTKILGRHTVKVGGVYNSLNYYGPIAGASMGFSPFQTADLNPAPNSKAITGDGLASFLLGVPNSSQRRDSLETEHNGSIDGVYVQDQWKVSPNLSLNLGFRYDVALWPYYGDFKSGQGYVGSMDLSNGTYVISATPPACSDTVGAPCIVGGALPANVVVTKNSNHGIHNTDYGNWQGRVGFAYRAAPNTSVRGGYSRFYDEWNGVAQFSQNVGGNWPSIGLIDIESQNQNIPTATITDPTSQGRGVINYPPATPFGNSTFYFNPSMKTPYTDQWNLGIDQQFNSATTMSISYVGSHSGRLDLGGIHNTARIPSNGTAAQVAQLRQYPYIVPTYYDDSTGNSNYHALQTRLTGHTHTGLTYLVSYTWSKSIDLASSGDFGAEGTSLQNPYNPQADRSVSGFDLTHIFSGSLVYELPFGRGHALNPSNRIGSYFAGGWQVNAIVNIASGAPFEVDYNGDNANTGNTFVRGNQIGMPFSPQRGQRQTGADSHGVYWLNTASFAIPDRYTFGTMGRNSLRGAANRNLDLSIFRTFPIHDALALTIRGESFNLTNTPIFSNPDTTLGDPNFGYTNSTQNNPRQVQLAAKFTF